MFRHTSELRSGDLRFARLFPKSTATIFALLIVFSLVIILNQTAFSAAFAGSNTGAIPDGGSPTPTCGAPRDIGFGVAGMTSAIGSVSVNFTMNPRHTFVGDLRVTLIAPDSTSHLLFSRVGAITPSDAGDNANLSGTYTFNDLAVNNIWTAAAANGSTNLDLPPVAYRLQAAGPAANTSPGPAFTSFNTAFSSIAPAFRNGTWILRFEDCSVADTGTVSAANLTILAPSAAGAALAGRVMTTDGTGIRNAVITIEGGNLIGQKTSLTGPFGYYSFEDIEAGQTYIVTANAKRYSFIQPVIAVTLDEDNPGIDFVAEPGY